MNQVTLLILFIFLIILKYKAQNKTNVGRKRKIKVLFAGCCIVPPPGGDSTLSRHCQITINTINNRSDNYYYKLSFDLQLVSLSKTNVVKFFS